MTILIKTVAGSHLFGTNTETSDKDFKGVYLPTKEEILLGSYKEVRSSSTGSSAGKNTKNDTDLELYSLKKFFKMLHNGDTSALEILFTPEHLIIEKHTLWDRISNYREHLVSSKVTSLIGYARHQANKFGTKGARLGELQEYIKELKTLGSGFTFNNPKLKHAWTEITLLTERYKHINMFTLVNDGANESYPAINVLGKKFDHHYTFVDVLKVLSNLNKSYGKRARVAKSNGGIDWKALSHALRVSCQGIELLEKGKITLPCIDSKLLLDIKLGNLDHNTVTNLIETKLETLEQLKKTTKLNKEVSPIVTNSILQETHMKVVLNEL